MGRSAEVGGCYGDCGSSRYVLRFPIDVTRADRVLGWVPTTEIGSGINDWMHKYAPDYPVTTIDESAKGIVSVITGLKLENAASFFNYDGKILPW